jgi:hypothetical protein
MRLNILIIESGLSDRSLKRYLLPGTALILMPAVLRQLSPVMLLLHHQVIFSAVPM